MARFTTIIVAKHQRATGNIVAVALVRRYLGAEHLLVALRVVAHIVIIVLHLALNGALLEKWKNQYEPRKSLLEIPARAGLLCTRNIDRQAAILDLEV